MLDIAYHYVYLSFGCGQLACNVLYISGWYNSGWHIDAEMTSPLKWLNIYTLIFPKSMVVCVSLCLSILTSKYR